MFLYLNTDNQKRYSKTVTSSKILRVSNKQGLFTCEGGAISISLFPRFLMRRIARPRIYVDYPIHTQRRCCQRTNSWFQEKASRTAEEDKEELIEIDPEILKMILEAPNLNKG